MVELALEFHLIGFHVLFGEKFEKESPEGAEA
jgi:hypothetical protein